MRLVTLKRNINIALFAGLGLNLAFWLGSSEMFVRWQGVPPVPAKTGAVIMGLGDAQMSYRFGAITLQGLGDGGGRVTPLKEYDFGKLGKWFWLLNDLDPASNHVPMLAAFYFGGTPVPKDIAVVVDYLEAIGQNPVGNKWRWLAHAVFLARHRMNDVDRALEIAYKLSRMNPIGDVMPAWARQMPAFVLADEKGDKQAARQIMENILLSPSYLHPNEINFMVHYLETEIKVPKAEIDAVLKKRQAMETESAPKQEPLPPPSPD